MFNNIDILSILSQLLPPSWRQIKFLELLEVLANVLKSVLLVFQSTRTDIINELIQPSTIDLEALLQKKHHPSIYIGPNFLKVIYIYSTVEQIPRYIYSNQEFDVNSPTYTPSAVVYYLPDSGIVNYGSDSDYFIYLPLVPLDVASINTTVKKYNLAGIKYQINQI